MRRICRIAWWWRREWWWNSFLVFFATCFLPLQLHQDKDQLWGAHEEGELIFWRLGLDLWDRDIWDNLTQLKTNDSKSGLEKSRRQRCQGQQKNTFPCPNIFFSLISFLLWLVCLQCVLNIFDICVIASDRLSANHQGPIFMEKRGRVKILSKHWKKK